MTLRFSLQDEDYLERDSVIVLSGIGRLAEVTQAHVTTLV
jgi:hypothetical protein